MTEGRDLESLLDGRPELVPELDRLLDVDEQHDAWRPSGAGIDPEVVTDLVRRGYAEANGDGYRLTDRSVVRAVVDRHRREATAGDRYRVGVGAALAVALALVVAVRLLPFSGVFRDGWVVLLSNDPYFYRYLVEQSLAGGPVPSLPERALRGEPLLVATLAAATALLGGSTWASGVVLAWYPVVAATVTGLLVYATGVRLTDDVRVGLVAVGLLAVTPAHAYRTAIGSADHHAFDYVWLALTLLAVVTLLSRGGRDRRTWVAAGGLAVGVAAQALSWEAGPLLFVPLAPALALVALVELRRGGPARLVPIVAGLVGGAALAHGVHLLLGWQSPVVVYSLDLLALGGLGLLAAAVVVARTGRSWHWLAAGEMALAAGAVVAVRVVPDVSLELIRGLDFLQGEGAAEMAGIGSTYGVYGPLLILGFAPVLALPALVWGVRRGWRDLEPGWFVVGVYAVHFAALAAVQRRFGGELAPVAAVLGSVAFVGFAAWLDLVRPLVPHRGTESSGDDLVVPDRTRLALLGGLAGVVVGTGSLYTKFIDDLIVIDEASYRAARWIHDYSEERGLEYPENYVLSKWGRNRMYNYFVNGEAESYAYARQQYEDFLFSSDGEQWYEEFAGRVGFVVTRDLSHLGLISSSNMQSRLHDRFGSATGIGTAGVGHYRALYATDDGARKVFRVVPGATVRGRSDADAVRLSTQVSIPNADFEYVRRVTVEDGSFAVTVAHPGTYEVGETTVTVPERAVREGERVTVDGT